MFYSKIFTIKKIAHTCANACQCMLRPASAVLLYVITNYHDIKKVSPRIATTWSLLC